ncbi:MAG: cysteine--tRNA ligase [Sulfobacillus thermosulfidooxidans]|nr:MAG: cysteine--tRNA ligase [Sulfobacillus thermosulfidooxidans]
MIYIYDTLTRQKRPFIPLKPPEVSIYVCGVTPYAEAHVGHARPAVMWDVIKRHLTRRGYFVRHVQNFTDIDDKIVRQALAEHEDPKALAERYMAQYTDVMQRLRVIPPDYAPRVTENIPQIIAFITELINKQMAYVSGHDVYFTVTDDGTYGQLSGRKIEDLYAGVRMEVHEGKRAPQDFALWKSADDTEPGWVSPWGYGRPGWHIECSTMAAQYLGRQFDLHGGGLDLVFPHHENERAQSMGYFGCEPASYWVHNGLITQDNVKMSKSLGNGLGLREILEQIDPVVLRTYLLSVHYRSPLDFQLASAEEWGRGLQRIWRLWDEAKNQPAPSEWVDEPWARRLESFEQRLAECLDDDFNTAKAFAEVFEMAHDVRYGMAQGHGALALAWARRNLQAADQILGLLPETSQVLSLSTMAERLLSIREQARARRDFQEADAIRNLLAKAGYTIEDTPEGPRILSQPSA